MNTSKDSKADEENSRRTVLQAAAAAALHRLAPARAARKMRRSSRPAERVVDAVPRRGERRPEINLLRLVKAVNHSLRSGLSRRRPLP